MTDVTETTVVTGVGAESEAKTADSPPAHMFDAEDEDGLRESDYDEPVVSATTPEQLPAPSSGAEEISRPAPPERKSADGKMLLAYGYAVRTPHAPSPDTGQDGTDCDDDL